MQLGPQTREAALIDQAFEGGAARHDLRILAFADLARIDGGAPEPGLDAGLQHGLHGGGRHDHQGVLRRLRQRGEIRVALAAPHFGQPRIDRIDFARISERAQIAENLRRPLRPLGRAHDGDGGRIEQRQRRAERRIGDDLVLQAIDPGLVARGEAGSIPDTGRSNQSGLQMSRRYRRRSALAIIAPTTRRPTTGIAIRSAPSTNASTAPVTRPNRSTMPNSRHGPSRATNIRAAWCCPPGPRTTPGRPHRPACGCAAAE